MSIDTLKAGLPDNAKDLKLNLSSVFNSTALTPRQAWGAALASAIASRNAAVIRAIEVEAAQRLDAPALTAAKAAAAIMGMNNIYYRFVHLSSTKDYGEGSIWVSGWWAAGPPKGRRAGLCLGTWHCGRTRTGQDSEAASPARCRGAAAAKIVTGTKRLPSC